MAVPGAVLAGMGLFAQSARPAAGRMESSGALRWAAAGFVLYGLTQVFVPSLEMPPANLINAESFLALTGIPHQTLRSALAVLITVSLIRAVQAVERARRAQLAESQQARLTALQQRETLRRELLRHVVQAQEDERARISRELHDETAQLLSAFTLELGALRNSLRPGGQEAPALDRLQDLSRQMSQGLYHLVHDLRPAQLDDLGLVPALKFLLEQDCCPKGLEIAFEVQGVQRRLDALTETVLFRVAQEGLNNVARHAGTKRAQLRILYEAERVTLQVIDAGCGFNPQEDFHPPRGWGLAGMRERVEAAGGRLRLESAPGRGTTVEVVLELRGGREAVLA
jgi:signal transduction histidine kinase